LVVFMGNETSVRFDKKKGILYVEIGNYNDIIKDGELA